MMTSSHLFCYNNIMNQDIEIMQKIYGTYELDWMGDKINYPSDLTRHHIIKKENDGDNDISNYALLTKSSHSLLHFLESNYNSDYKLLNELFLELNRSESVPNNEYYDKIRLIMKKVKKSIKNKRRGRV